MRSQVAALQGEGVLGVEMEAAALFAAGQALGVEVAAALAIADAMSGLRWKLDFDPARALSGLEALFECALQALASP
jgi:purine-nucleoside phosphorylase